MPRPATARITWEFMPDPQEYANRMWLVSDSLRDAHAPLLFAAKQTREEIKASFLSQTSPDGREWPYWEDSYEPVALAYPNEGILRQTTNLYEAATDEKAFIVSGDTLFYDTSDWPWSGGKNPIQYGWVHQEGSNTVARREFVGVSKEGESKITAAFVGWFENSLALFVTKAGKLGIRGRSSLGTFLSQEPMPFRPGRRRIR